MHNAYMRLFSKNQLLLLQLFYTNSGKSFYLQEIGKIIKKKPGVFQRTLNQLVKNELILSEYRANSRYFRANTVHPLYPEFKKIIDKTIGVEGFLRELFANWKSVKMALLYGSYAKGKERPDSDIDLLIVGNPDVETRILRKLPDLERKFQREINYKLYSSSEYAKKREKKDPFLEEILTDKVIVLKGDPHAI